MVTKSASQIFFSNTPKRISGNYLMNEELKNRAVVALTVQVIRGIQAQASQAAPEIPVRLDWMNPVALLLEVQRIRGYRKILEVQILPVQREMIPEDLSQVGQ